MNEWIHLFRVHLSKDFITKEFRGFLLFEDAHHADVGKMLSSPPVEVRPSLKNLSYIAEQVISRCCGCDDSNAQGARFGPCVDVRLVQRFPSYLLLYGVDVASTNWWYGSCVELAEVMLLSMYFVLRRNHNIFQLKKYDAPPRFKSKGKGEKAKNDFRHHNFLTARQ